MTKRLLTSIVVALLLPISLASATPTPATGDPGLSPWARKGASSGGGAFDSITSGTNITAAMLVGTGASLTVTGSGTITATNLTGAVTGATSVTVSTPSVGTAATPGIQLTNATAATNGAQQYSPVLILSGRGFETTGSSSQAADWTVQVRPVQGTTLTSTANWSSQINGGGYTSRMQISTGGNFSVTGAVNAATGFSLGGTTIYAHAGGVHSIQLGPNAGASLTSAQEATCIGDSACNALISNIGFTAVGYGAGLKSTGVYNTYIGGEAGAYWSASTGGFNTCTGALSCQDQTGANFNTASGYNALTHTTSGSENVSLGYNTGSGNAGAPNSASLTTGTGDILIGSLANVDAAGANYRLAMGYGAVAKVDNTAVFGSAGGGTHYSDFYFGYGYDKASIGTVTTTLNATGGLGTDQPGATLGVAGGVSTGTGLGGGITFSTTTAAGSTAATRNTLAERFKIQGPGHAIFTELAVNPSAANLTSGANAEDKVAIYMKADRMIIAVNLSGTVNYLSTPLDGVGTAGVGTWSWSTSAP